MRYPINPSCHPRCCEWVATAVVLLLLLSLTPVLAGEADDESSDERTPAELEALMEERVRVIGSPSLVEEISGSAHFIAADEMQKQSYSDVQRTLRRVPGVNLQDEEGYGLRPNIGMRGSGVERSQKVTVMEDGVLIAPAPYSAPSAYYFPTAARMESIEVSKGPAAIRQGPQTNGGALNLLSSSIPNDLSGEAELSGGDDDHKRARLRLGDSTDRFGWLVESYRQSTDGFKELDTGGTTGFDLEDYVAKLRLNSGPEARFYQSLELKLGLTEQDGDETYLGLAPEDFDLTPYRRYTASSEDYIVTEHEQVQLRHFFVANPDLDVTTTLYYNDFFRNWHKLESLSDVLVDDELKTVKVSSILADTTTFADEVDILRGDVFTAADKLNIRNNRRDYYSRGVQTVVGLRRETSRARHAMEFGLRVHEDEEDRFQEEDGYAIENGAMVLTSSGAPGSQSNRISDASAVALFVEDRIEMGRWTLTPGVRWENIQYERRDFGKEDPLRTGAALKVKRNDVNELIPGVGVDYRLGAEWRLFGGVHRGFSPPGPGQDEETKPEDSVNYEAGFRFTRGNARIQSVLFYNDYDNLLGTDTVSSGGDGTGDRFNGGEVRVHGLELSFEQDFARSASGTHTFPFRVAYTYTAGEFRNSFETDFADWAPEVEIGDELPYLPEHQLFAEIGWRSPRWGMFVSSSYVSEMRTNAGQGPIPEAESIEDHLLFDLSLEHTFRTHYRAFLQVRNLTDEVYVAARRPAGLRPGLPRTALVGFGFRF